VKVEVGVTWVVASHGHRTCGKGGGGREGREGKSGSSADGIRCSGAKGFISKVERHKASPMEIERKWVMHAWDSICSHPISFFSPQSPFGFGTWRIMFKPEILIFLGNGR